ncbi:MAG: MBL fold metallo-hydrolase [Deltaproteobacteria bacterium]|nr:MBL fold metallo-hydrolase [Deltaproteobacteria bacterium]
MGITNAETGTRVDEIADGVYRIHTPVPPSLMPGGFSFNQYLIVDDEPLLFHTGGRRLFPLVSQAIASVMPIERLRWVGFSHVESDECGALNELLAIAPRAQPVCGQTAAMVSMQDLSDRPPRALADGERLSIGRRALSWIDTPHLPHGWECGYMFDHGSRTLLCGDLLTQPGHEHEPLTRGDILGPSEAMRKVMDYHSHSKNTAQMLDKLARHEPTTLACMHGAAWAGDGAALLWELARALG